MLRVTLLGTPQIHLNGTPLRHPLVGKELALLAYLALSREPCPRARLADLLWENVSEARARENLRSLLYSLRQTLGEYLCVTRHAVWLNRQLPYWLDVEVFTELPVAHGLREPHFRAEVLKLYQGDFLDGTFVASASVFEAWLLGQRERLHSLAVNGWQQLARLCWERGEHDEALAANRRLLHLAPWSEEAHRQQMQLLAATGQRSAALAHYGVCCQNLRTELDIDPSSETLALYEQIKGQGKLPGAVAAPAPGQLLCSRFVPVFWGALSPPGQFWGRAYELATLQQWLVAERCRVVFILGQGGAGKTALAAQLAQTLAATAATYDAIVVNSWPTRPPLATLLTSWLQRLGEQPHQDCPRTLEQQLDLLRSVLEQRRVLLVIDNYASGDVELNGEGAAYLRLWQLFLEHEHQSALLLTARTAPELHGQPEEPGRFRQLFLDGLALEDSRQLLASYRLQGSAAEYGDLHAGYDGNPLALRYAAQVIDELFDGNIGLFLRERAFFFGDIAELVAQQLACLLPLEQELLTWLALAQEPISRQQLWDNLVAAPARGEYLAAIHCLFHRSLVEVCGAQLRVKPMIGSYVETQLCHAICQEVSQSAPPPDLAAAALNRYDLGTALAPRLRAAEQRQLVELILEQLLHQWNPEELEAHLLRLYTHVCVERLSDLSRHSAYAADNLFTLLRGLEELKYRGQQQAPVLFQLAVSAGK